MERERGLIKSASLDGVGMARQVFGPYQLDPDERRLLRNGVEVRLRGKVFDTLCVLVKNSGRLLRKEELLRAVWPDTIVEQNNLDYCISQLRKVFGSENAFIETVPRQGYRFVANVSSGDEHVATAQARAAIQSRPYIPPQQIHFFNSLDGVKIAYSIAGSGPPLLKTANWLNHLEFELQSPLWASWFSLLTSHHTLVRYDERGNGLSDWNIQDFSFKAWVRDIEELVDTVNLERFPLLGISQGAAVAVNYAVQHPGKVSKLILIGPFASGWRVRSSPRGMERWNALHSLIRSGWGKDNPVFRRLWSTLFIPEGTPEQAEWFTELQRVTTSPANAAQLLWEMGDIDVFDLLPEVKCPTLVLHSRDDAVVPVHEGRRIASRIPGATFVEMPSPNHIVIAQEPAWDVFVTALTQFLEWQ